VFEQFHFVILKVHKNPKWLPQDGMEKPCALSPAPVNTSAPKWRRIFLEKMTAGSVLILTSRSIDRLKQTKEVFG